MPAYLVTRFQGRECAVKVFLSSGEALVTTPWNECIWQSIITDTWIDKNNKTYPKFVQNFKSITNFTLFFRQHLMIYILENTAAINPIRYKEIIAMSFFPVERQEKILLKRSIERSWGAVRILQKKDEKIPFVPNLQ